MNTNRIVNTKHHNYINLLVLSLYKDFGSPEYTSGIMLEIYNESFINKIY